MDLKQYRLIDLSLLTVLAALSEVMGDYLHQVLPGAGFYLSFSVLITLVAIMRWGKAGSVVLMIATIPMIFLGPNTIGANIVMYPVASLSIYGVAAVLNRIDKDQVYHDSLKLLILVVGTFAILAIGKGWGLMLLRENGLLGASFYFISNMFNMVMTFVVLILIRNRKGLLTDMKNYFEREQNNHEYSS